MKIRTSGVIALLAVASLGLAGCAKSPGSSGSTTEDAGSNSAPSAAAPAPAPKSDYVVKITGSSLDKDYEGKQVIVVSYDFTNNSDKAQNFMFAVKAQAFQGGIELSDLAIGVDSVDSSLALADVKPGSTVTVKEAYILRDNSTVSVEVRELISFDDELLASQDFTVDG